MEITRIADLRPRFVWDIVDDAFDLYRERFLSFLTIAAVVFVPFRLLQIGLTEGLIKRPDYADDKFAAYFGTVFVAVPIAALVNFLVYCAVVVAVQSKLEGREPQTVGSIYRSVLRRAGSVIGGLLYVTFWESIGLLSGGIITLYFFVSTIFLAPAILVEKRRLRAALKRSNQLSTADQGRVLGVIFLSWLITTMLTAGLAALAGAAIAAIPIGGGNAIATASIGRITGEIISALGELGLTPFTAIALTLLYFDLRVRREGVDLVAAAEESGVTLAPDPFGDLPSDRVLRDQNKRRRRR